MWKEFMILYVLVALSMAALFGFAVYMGYRQGRKNQVAMLAEALNQMATNHATALKTFHQICPFCRAKIEEK